MLKELLGAGQYGRVYAAEDKQTAALYAVKTIPKTLPGLDARTQANYQSKIRREVDTQIALARAQRCSRPSAEVSGAVSSQPIIHTARVFYFSASHAASHALRGGR